MLYSARIQWWLLLRHPSQLAPVFGMPFYSIIFLAIIKHSGREDLATSLEFSAVLMTLWSTAVFIASNIVDTDRVEGIFEFLLTARTSYTRAAAARIGLIMALGMSSCLIVTLVGQFGFGLPIHISAPLIALLVLVVTVFGIGGFALMVSGLIIAVQGARSLQNALTYPFFVLGGLIIPAYHLPQPFRFSSEIFFLSIGSRLLNSVANYGWTSQDVPVFAELVTLVSIQIMIGAAVLKKLVLQTRAGQIGFHE